MNEQQLKGHLEPLLLGVLSRGPAHGYAVIRRLAEDSGGRFDLPEGTVYPALYRLERSGLLRSSWDSSGARRRRIYAITGHGRRVLAAQRRAFDDFTRGVRSVLEGSS